MNRFGENEEEEVMEGMKHFNRTVTVLVFIFLYIPMIVLGVASFNAGTDIATFKGFTLKWYSESVP